MGMDYSAVLVYGMQLDRELIDKWDFAEIVDDWSRETNATIKIKYEEDCSHKWIDLENGLYIYKASYAYDGQDDIYVCCAYFECDDYFVTPVDIPAISTDLANAIDARLRKAIAEKGIEIEIEPPRWYLMSRGS